MFIEEWRRDDQPRQGLNVLLGRKHSRSFTCWIRVDFVDQEALAPAAHSKGVETYHPAGVSSYSPLGLQTFHLYEVRPP